jgi:hypothetical protein
MGLLAGLPNRMAVEYMKFNVNGGQSRNGIEFGGTTKKAGDVD